MVKVSSVIFNLFFQGKIIKICLPFIFLIKKNEQFQRTVPTLHVENEPKSLSLFKGKVTAGGL